MDLPEQRSPQARHRKTTILVADDDGAILSLLSELLHHHEFAVVTAQNGAQALARARDLGNTIDLLLTDFEMPLMNGVQLAAAIRQFLPHVRVVLMSGSHDLEGVAGNGATFLRKPFTSHLLLKTISGSLGDGHGDR